MDGYVAAYSPEYNAVRSIAFLVVMAYPLLVPLCFFSLLWRVRDSIMAGKKTRLTRSLLFLHGACKSAPAGLMAMCQSVCQSTSCGVWLVIKSLFVARRQMSLASITGRWLKRSVSS